MTRQKSNEELPPNEKSGAAGDGNLAVPMRLRDFLAGVAAIYNLPERRRKLEKIVPARKKKEGTIIPAIRKNAIVIAAAVTAVIWAAATINKAPTELGILPEAMNGGWHTKDVRYRDRAFWIKGNRIAFQTGTDSMEVTIHKITQVDQKLIGGDTLQYTVQYLVDGAPTTWAIQFSERPRPEIRFLNQRELAWTPAPNSPWPTP